MIDFNQIRTYPIRERQSNKESLERFPRLEDIAYFHPLQNPDLEEFAERIQIANKNNRKVILMIGGHVIKTGMSTYLIDLMKRNLINHIAMNGAGSIHDFEIAMIGKTSEDVQAGIYSGSFGMVEETGRIMNEAIKESAKEDQGYGSAIGRKISELDFSFKEFSILYNAYKLNMPATVHVAIGTDIIHQHPSCDGSAIGKTSYQDFKTFTDSISQLKEGVIINLGSAVIMPEVFLKALTISRNLGYDVSNITTANFDMLNHYRPRVNLVERPVQALGGKGFSFIGKHQELVPSLYKLLIKRD